MTGLAAKVTPIAGGSLPTGTVTFLFADIEGSTRLWEQHPEAMQSALARHDALLRQAVEANNGRIVKTTGDGLHAVFDASSDAIAAALSGQRALSSEPWPPATQLRVRMALHVGEAEYRDGDYYGPALNRAVRLMAIGHGGQVLLSAITAGLARELLPASASLDDLGEHRLKDLVRPERVFQLSAPGLPADFPPLRSLDTFPNNLPVQLTSFIGRENQIAEAKRLLDTTHLLTLTGPGGTGKTRLSLQVAADLLERFTDGVWLVELAPLADPALVAQALAAALGVRDIQGRSLLDVLTDYLRQKHILLVLDNCEHLVEACSELTHHLLRACPQLRILASSREALGVAGEVSLRVPSLSLPQVGQPTADALTRSEAARLFVERARANLNEFTVTAENAPVIAQICRRLDGIPLALELAAGRVKMLTVEQIAARLDDRFRLLTGGSRTVLPRQQTLRAMMDWSWDLLTEPECLVLRRLSVFAGGWALEAAEAVSAEETAQADAVADQTVQPGDVLDVLAQLVNKSLVVVEGGQGGEARYRLLETIRQYAREKLLAAGADEALEVRRRHLGCYLALTEAAEPHLIGREMIAWLDRLEMEQDNLRTALEWALEDDPLAALRFVAVLYIFWGRRASLAEGYTWAKAALARAEASPLLEKEAAPPYLAAKARALGGVAALAFFIGEGVFARANAEAGIALARQIGDSMTLAYGLGLGAIMCGTLGDVDTARAWAEESMTISRQHGYAYGQAMVSGAQMLLVAMSDQPTPSSLIEEVVRVARASGNPWTIGMAFSNVGRVAAMTGDLDEAYTRFQEARDLFLALGDRTSYIAVQSEIGHVLRKQGRYDEAGAVYRESIPRWLETGNKAAVAHELECFGSMASAQMQYERAARLFGAAEALREALNSHMTPLERPEYDQAVAALHGQMDGASLTQAWAEGRTLSMDEAVAYATQVVP